VGATNQVTWTLGDLDASASPIVLEVTVLFRSSSFATGAEVGNWFELTGTGDSGPVSYRSNVDRATLRPQGLVPIARKQRNRAELGPGQFDTYTLSGTAPDTADLTSLMITDRLPAGLVAVQDGAPNLSGSGPSPVVEVRVGGGIQSIPPRGPC
jgi:uncharacterized repeat protein (TIGR01451 family)